MLRSTLLSKLKKRELGYFGVIAAANVHLAPESSSSETPTSASGAQRRGVRSCLPFTLPTRWSRSQLQRAPAGAVKQPGRRWSRASRGDAINGGRVLPRCVPQRGDNAALSSPAKLPRRIDNAIACRARSLDSRRVYAAARATPASFGLAARELDNSNTPRERIQFKCGRLTLRAPRAPSANLCALSRLPLHSPLSGQLMHFNFDA